MIKITILTGGPEKSSLFSEASVYIGDMQKTPGTAFLPLSGRGLKPEHVRIFIENGELWVQNTANDPFVTLGGQPFYKKLATPGATLRIREVDLKIELTEQTTEISAEKAPEKISGRIQEKLGEKSTDNHLEKVEEIKKEIKRELPKDTTSSRNGLFENKPLPVAPSFLKEALHPTHDPHDFEEVIHSSPKFKKEMRPRPSLKDTDTHSDKESSHLEEPTSWTMHLNVSPFRHVKLLSFFMMVAFLILTVVAVESYLRAGEKSDEEELKAAESLSDISMALTYAQFSHITPQKHNWSDPEFIQNNLLATVPTGSGSESVLNSQGEFAGGHYILRVYCSNDLSHFLIVAHPTPTLLQWLIPKSAIIVDSNSMELRRIRDLKLLNRLLANLNTLDGINSSQISDLVKKGEIITLSYLSKMAKKPEFQPPRALAFLRPGAENLIYNAPRYHQFGDALLKKTSHFASIHTSSHELSMLKSELEVLKKFPNLVFYTTDSLEEAKAAVRSLKKIGPHEKYLLASIKYDQVGKFSSTKIVMDLEKKAVATPAKLPSPFVATGGVFDIGPVKFDIIPTDKLQAPSSTTKEELAVSDEIKSELPPVENVLTNDAGIQSENEIKDPLTRRLDDIVRYREEELQKLQNSVIEASNKFINDPNRKKLIRALNKIIEEKGIILDQIKEDLFDLSFDFEEVDPEVLKTKLHERELDGTWKEVFKHAAH